MASFRLYSLLLLSPLGLLPAVSIGSSSWVEPAGKTPVGPRQSPRESLIAFDAIARSGSIDDAIGTYFTADSRQEAFARSCARADIMLARLQLAATDRFGAQAGEAAVHATGQKTIADLAHASVDCDGTDARVVWEDGSELPLVRVGRRWRVSIPRMIQEMSDIDVARFKNQVEALADGLERVATSLDAGGFATPDALTQRVENLTERAMSNEPERVEKK